MVDLEIHLERSSIVGMGAAHEGRAFDIIGEVARFKKLSSAASLGRLVS